MESDLPLGGAQILYGGSLDVFISLEKQKIFRYILSNPCLDES